MARFTEAAKTALSVQDVQTGPIPPAQTASTPLSLPPPGGQAGVSGIAQGGLPTGLQAAPAAPNAGGAAIRSDQPQPQPGMQTTQSLPQTKAPGAQKAFAAPKPSAKPSAPPAPALPKAAPKPSAKTSALYPLKIASVLSPASPGILASVTGGLGMHPESMSGGLVGKALGGLEAVNRADALFRIPGMAADGASWVKDQFSRPSATEVLDSRKTALHGLPPPPAPGQMPQNPSAQFGSITDIVEPLKHPIRSAKDFLSGLGQETDRQLTQSMIEQPVTIHQLQYQHHPNITT